jgi:hypothetical protein
MKMNVNYLNLKKMASLDVYTDNRVEFLVNAGYDPVKAAEAILSTGSTTDALNRLADTTDALQKPPPPPPEMNAPWSKSELPVPTNKLDLPVPKKNTEDAFVKGTKNGWASHPVVLTDARIEQLELMGFDPERAIAALELENNSMSRTIARLQLP